jgi:hypothetical protein
MHPSHNATANAVFRPTPEEVAYLEGVLRAFEDARKAGLGAVKYQGAIVDHAMLPLAREVLAEANGHTGQTQGPHIGDRQSRAVVPCIGQDVLPGIVGNGDDLIMSGRPPSA